VTYRDDHAAALARIHALESENDRLRAENLALRDDRASAAPRQRVPGVGLKLVLAAAIAIPALGLAFGSVYAVRHCAVEARSP
jgi:hypothetical protein